MLFTHAIHLLLIEDEEYDVRRIRNTLKPLADRVLIRDVVASGAAALALLEKAPQDYDVIIMDFQISGGLMGETLIRKIKEIDASLQIIIVTKMTARMTDFDFAGRLLAAGAMWYCTKYPGDIEEYIYQPTDFLLSIYNAYEKNRLEKERRRSERKLERRISDIMESKQLIGRSAALATLQKEISQCAATDAHVLIRGLSGTGKELVANHIHYASRRRLENLVTVNCASLPENLIESELFGYEKGSFTGATERKPGFFELAHRGAIFLDEISELPLPAQSKLLRVLQDGEIDKIGRTDKIKVDVRVLSATNVSLEKAVEEQRFRRDLYYRLTVVMVDVPPLLQRREDIPLLLDHFLNLFSRREDKPAPELTPEALQRLLQYDWPGNIRELQNVVQRLLYTGESSISLAAAERALGLLGHESMTEGDLWRRCWSKEHMLPWRDMEREFRSRYFTFIREQCTTDAEAARLLGLAPPNYHRMCKEIGLKD
jgi:two-component system, NtrC family, response regulator AtoC